MACAECSRLLAEYDRLEKGHEAAISNVYEVIRTSLAPDYRELAMTLDHALRDLEAARWRLEQHERGHPRASRAAG
jgi:hypothetical protein